MARFPERKLLKTQKIPAAAIISCNREKVKTLGAVILYFKRLSALWWMLSANFINFLPRYIWCNRTLPYMCGRARQASQWASMLQMQLCLFLPFGFHLLPKAKYISGYAFACLCMLCQQDANPVGILIHILVHPFHFPAYRICTCILPREIWSQVVSRDKTFHRKEIFRQSIK